MPNKNKKAAPNMRSSMEMRSAIEMKTPMEMRSAMEMNSPVEFNAGLRKASKDGKLDNNPKFKAAVDSSMQMQGSPYMLYGEKASPATMQGESPIAKYGCSKKMKRSK